MSFIFPQWPAHESVRALVSTRSGGVSNAPFDSLNLGDHVGDSIENVQANRALFSSNLPSEPLWLRQTHGTVVSTPQIRKSIQEQVINADAAVTNLPGEVLVVMTADCLPVLFANPSGTAVGVAHAGWRGLCAGILENTVAELRTISDDESVNNLMAWLGPAIGPEKFEVGQDVVDAFKDVGLPLPKNAFEEIPNKKGKYLADIYQLARGRLEACGVKTIFGGEFCTVKDSARFFSYRRDGETGRFATAIWISR